MGCILSKTATVIPIITTRTEEHLLNNVKWNEQQNTAAQETPSQIAQVELHHKTINRTRSPKSSEAVRKARSAEESTLNNLEEVTRCHATIARPSTTKTTTADVHKKATINITSNVLKQRSVHDKLNTESVSTNSEKVAIQCKTVRAVDVESILSVSSEDNTSNGISNEFDESSCSYDDIVSSSSSTNTEKTIFRQDTLVRFTSMKQKHSDAHQGTGIDDFYSDADESYPIHKSFVTSTSSYSEESSTHQDTVSQAISTDKKQLDVRPNCLVDETSNDSYFPVINSRMSSDSEEIAIKYKTVIKYKSPILTTSDTQQKNVVYQTSSDSNQSYKKK